MAYRGRGRGRGGGPGSYDHRPAKHEPYVDFPENITLPKSLSETWSKIPNWSDPDEIKALIKSGEDLRNFWKSSCYYLEETAAEPKMKDTEIERYSDRFKIKTEEKREALASYLKLTTSHFPSELIQGAKVVRHDYKKLRWDGSSGEKVSDLFEKLVEKHEGQNEKASKGKQGDEEEEEEVEQEEAEESDDEDGDDYCKNEEFDDDEDDANIDEEPDEDVY